MNWFAFEIKMKLFLVTTQNIAAPSAIIALIWYIGSYTMDQCKFTILCLSLVILSIKCALINSGNDHGKIWVIYITIILNEKHELFCHHDEFSELRPNQRLSISGDTSDTIPLTTSLKDKLIQKRSTDKENAYYGFFTRNGTFHNCSRPTPNRMTTKQTNSTLLKCQYFDQKKLRDKLDRHIESGNGFGGVFGYFEVILSWGTAPKGLFIWD